MKILMMRGGPVARAAAPLLMFVALLALSGCQSASPAQEVILLTTTSVRDSGLLDVLVATFHEQAGYHVKPIVAGSGDILKQGSLGEGDVILSHSPKAEEEFMNSGNGRSRRLVMYNDFVLVGPPSDPARVRGLRPVEALRRVAAERAPFVSRGDNSGTHLRERELWRQAGSHPDQQPWYTQTGLGQGQTLEVASTQERYTLTDRGTYLVHRKRLALAVLVENDVSLINVYHLIEVNAAKFPRVNEAGRRAFADFLLGPEGQRIIGQVGVEKYGRSLFVPAGGKSLDDLSTLFPGSR